MAKQNESRRLIAALCFAALFCPQSEAEALNSTTEALLAPLFQEGRKARPEELTALLFPIAADEETSNMHKMREMGYVVYISGWHLSKSEKRTLFNTVFATLDEHRKEKYLAEHSELDANIRSAIQSGQVIVGMSKASVIASFGKPEELRPPMGTFMNTERWSYFSKRLVLFFKDELLASYKALS